MWLIPLFGLVTGLLIGYILNIEIPISLVKYLSIGVLAAIDSIFGGIKSIQNRTFNSIFLVTGFFTNILLAAFFAFLGDKLGIDLYLAAVFAFGVRIFSNLAKIRHFIICKYFNPGYCNVTRIGDTNEKE